jgi:hypothetical protein
MTPRKQPPPLMIEWECEAVDEQAIQQAIALIFRPKTANSGPDLTSSAPELSCHQTSNSPP